MAVAVAGIATTLLTGCSADNRNGPLQVGGLPSKVCVPEPDRGNAIVGVVVKNDGSSDIQFDNVSLVESQNLSANDASVIALQSGMSAIGSGSTVPTSPAQEKRWASRTDPDSVLLEPGNAANIVVALEREVGAQSGRASAIRVTYRVDQEEFVAESTTKIVLTSDKCS